MEIRNPPIPSLKKPVNGVSDLKGKKIRVPNQTILIKVFESLGATPTPMAMSDIYTALQQGTIDGAENPLRLS
ncbi:MAG: TRAP transporter substrate-binding protein DctP [Enterocloster sp.]